ncbi:hypothetical protein [Aeromonas sobria]|uniref:hypothetical protein n=1 Tax=Aeromonas sobria TaxID=646 RepID=UPI000C6D48D2|nr:hypothetical protein [Aeromonas sobria]PKQ78088.1 hypothetical protein CJF47_07350 [Aeromonas sobria]
MPVTKTTFTAENTAVFVNFTGPNIAAATVTNEILDVTEFGGMVFTRDVKTVTTIKGVERSASGRRANGEIEMTFLLNTANQANIVSFQAAMDDVTKSEVTMKVTYPWGDTWLGNYIVTKFEKPSANEEISVVKVSLKPNGAPTCTYVAP